MSQLVVKVGSAAPPGGHGEHGIHAAELKRLLISVIRLTSCQKVELLAALTAGGHDEEVRLIVQSRLTQTQACPHCNGARIVLNGSAGGLQRYKCRTCRRTFNALTTTPLARLRMKAKWLQQQDALYQGLSVN